MEKYLMKIKPKHYGVVVFLLTCIATYVMLSYEQVLSTGIYVFIEGDTLTQFVPFVKMFFRDLMSGESLWYSWSMSMGQNTALTYAFYVWNPFNLFFLLEFLDEAVIVAIIFILKTGLTAFFFQKFAVKVLDCKGVESIVFSLFYALCSFHVIYNVLNIMWIDALYMLPLICQLIYQLKKDGKWKGLMLAYAYLFITQFYMAFIVGIFTFLFMILLWVFDEEKKGRIRKSLKYVSGVVLAIGISAVIWVPTLLFLYGNNVENALAFEALKANIFDILFNLSWGQMQGVEGIYPYIYCGIPTIILCVLFFFNKRIRIKEKICVGILGIFLLTCMLFMPFYKFMHAFDAPDMLGFRFSFLLSFLMCAVACKQGSYIRELSKRKFSVITSGVLILYVILYVMQADAHWYVQSNIWITMVGNIIFLTLWILIFVFAIKKARNQFVTAILIIAVTVLEVVSNGYATYMVMGSDGMERHYNVYKDSIETGVSMLEEDGFYRTRYMNDYVMNSDAWFDYKGISDFATARNVVLQDAMSSLGHYACRNIISDIGNTPVTDMLFGIKYVINGVHPYIMAMQIPDPTVTENEYALSLGYMVEEEVLTYQFLSLHAFDNMDTLLQSMTGEDINCFENVSEDLVVVDVENTWYDVSEEGICVGRNNDNSEEGYIHYKILAQEGKTVYVQFQNEENRIIPNAPLLLGGEENSVSDNGYITVSYARKLDIADGMAVVSVLFPENVMPVTTYQQANFSYYNGSELTKAYDILSQNQMEIEKYGNAYIDANVTVPEERTVLFTSIPYDEGWTVYVDGVETETKAVVGDAFIALELEPGYHDLEFRYEAPGARTGMAVSGISLGIYGILIAADLVKSKKRKAKEGNVKPDVENRTE